MSKPDYLDLAVGGPAAALTDSPLFAGSEDLAIVFPGRTGPRFSA
jgi:hypothetical protein